MVSGSSEEALFFPLGEELSVPPFGAASFEEAIASLSSPSKGIISSILTSTGSGLVYDKYTDRRSGHKVAYLSIRAIAA